MKTKVGFMVAITAFMSCNYFANVRLLTNGSVADKNYEHTIPFEYIKGLIVVEATLNADSIPRQFIFDTGAFNSKIEKTVADSLQLQTFATKENSTAAGLSRNIEVTRLDSLQLGDVLFRKIGAGKLEYAPTSASYCIADDGIIGANLIQLAHWKIDFHNTELTFSDTPFELQEGVARLPFTQPVFSGVPTINLSIENTMIEGILFDLGFNGGLILPTEFAQEFESEEEQILIDKSTTGIYGTNTDTLIIKQLEVSFDGFTTTVPVEFSSIGKALLGNEFLEHFDVFIDYKQKEISLAPVSEVKIPLGYQFIPGVLNDSLWVVTRTHLESEFQLGDTLTWINNKTPRDYFSNYCEYVMGIRALLESDLLITKMDESTLTVPAN